MDPRLLRYYDRELQHVRDMGGEFAREYPKIAGRLGLEGLECSDPYVERLLEGFAFIAARVQLKVDSEFPQFTRHLIQMVYPHYLCPTPSMAVARFQPNMAEGGLADGFVLPRRTALKSLLGKGDQTACEYRTAHEVCLWPVEVTALSYLPTTGAVYKLSVPQVRDTRAALRVRLRAGAGLRFSQLTMDHLSLYLHGADKTPALLYEQLLANLCGVVVRPVDAGGEATSLLGPERLRREGLEPEDALIPYGNRSFQGYRLLHEYFAFPNRCLFVRLEGLQTSLPRCDSEEIELIFLLNRSESELHDSLSTDNIQLFCTPIVNLFERRTDRIHLDHRHHEYHVVVDRTRPLDFEVYALRNVVGHGTSADEEQAFLPFYAMADQHAYDRNNAYYAVSREPRQISSGQRRKGPRSSYIGSEVFISLVDPEAAPYRSDLRQLSMSALCTNRDLPLQMAVGKGTTDFTMETSAPLTSVRILAGPTPPRASPASGDTDWRFISHLSLNYLSLVDGNENGAAALREMLALYCDPNASASRREIEGLLTVDSRPITRQLSDSGPLTFGRGLEIRVNFDDAAFEGSGAFLLGSVLEAFFARHVSINSFTETVVETMARGEIMRWATRKGQRKTL